MGKVKLISTRGLTKDLINKYCIIKSGKHFSLDGSQNYLVFQRLCIHFTSKNGKIYSWKSQRISVESITPPSTTDHNFDPEIIYKSGDIKVRFDGIWLRQDSISFVHGNVVYSYISYKFDT